MQRNSSLIHFCFQEIDVDAIAQDGIIKRLAISEHVENAGVHSGDASLVTPPQDLTPRTIARIREIMATIAAKLNANGPLNCQLIAKDDNLAVIECNLRVSRSFPFVSKVLGCDMISDATRVIMGYDIEDKDIMRGIGGKIGVKVPVFSFSRLTGADVCLGVEMSSTGEVGGFGTTREEAYLKALLGTGFKTPPLPGGAVLLSIGHHKAREELLDSVMILHRLGCRLFASIGTADFFTNNEYYKKRGMDIKLIPVEWPFESNGSSDDDVKGIGDYVTNKEFDLIINIAKRGRGAYRVSSFVTNGYKTRRMAVDNGIPLVTDVKSAKLLIKALQFHGRMPPLKPQTDCINSARIIRLPGLVDVHVHTRCPGEDHKEDWTSVTRAALAGGVTMILAMPNTKPPLTNLETLETVAGVASSQACCDFGLHAQATGTNAADIKGLASGIVGLKMYLNQTHNSNEDKMADVTTWSKHFELCPSQVPIMVHAEGQTMATIMFLVFAHKRPVHVCHVSTREEIIIVKTAKERGLPVTCEVCPHHLFLNRHSRPILEEGGAGEVRPRLAKQDDQDALWEHIHLVDVFATDHAPHLWIEKVGPTPPPGFPGLETMLPLLLNAVNEGRLTLQDIITRCHENPRRIFGLPEQPDTYVEVDMDERWEIPSVPAFTKAGWTPFAGMRVRGMVRRVVVRREEAYVDGRVLVPPGFGQDIRRGYVAGQGRQGVPIHVDTVPIAPPPPSPLLPQDQSIYSPRNFTMQEEYKTVLKELQVRSSSTQQPTAGLQVNVGGDGQRSGPCSPAMPGSLLSMKPPISGPIRDQRMSGQPRRRVESGTSISIPRFKNVLRAQSVLSVTQFVDTFKRESMHFMFEIAAALKEGLRQNKWFNGRPINSLLAGHRVASVFYEVSTRTSMSFKVAMETLGGQVDEVTTSTSSVKKGESLEDTILVLSGYRASAVILRHPDVGSAQRAAAVAPVPVINAGDGAGEHPTQALLDIFTIREEIGTVNNLTVTLVGDLKHGRTVHSLARLLTLYDVRFKYVCPPGLEMPQDVQNYIRAAGKQQTDCGEDLTGALHDTDVLYMTRIQRERFSSDEAYKRTDCGEDLTGALHDTDVLYMTRIQRERFSSDEAYKRACGKIVITPQVMLKAKHKMIVMHPLPRIDEISTEFDLDPRACYFRQAENGLYVRMALLAMVLGAIE